MRVIELLVWSLGMVQRCWGYTYKQGGLRVRVGEVRKWMDVSLQSMVQPM
jgi:hypothetical protein